MDPTPCPENTRGASATAALAVTDVLRLGCGPLVLELAPQVGGSIAAFYNAATADKPRVDWLRPASPAALAAHDPLGMASFPLVPWCNRLRDGRAQAQGREIRLFPNLPNSPHTLHGLGWQRPWQLCDSQPDAATLAFSHDPVAARDKAFGWPWAFSAWQTFKLDDAGLACQLTLRNDSDTVMPFGLGHHPYFLHTPGTRLQCQLSADARMWETDATCLPTRLGQPAFLAELRKGLALAELNLDNNFTGWQRCFRVDWTEPRRYLTLTAASPLDFFVLYCPTDRPFFCAEPVSNCTDWLNLKGQATPEALGGGELAPGATCSTTFRMDVWLDQGQAC